MRRTTRITEYPTIKVAVPPRVLEALSAEAEERSLPLSAIVREALDRAVRPAPTPEALNPQG